jgi:glycosyltransferase involved in cell wall biosynthesis
MIKVGLPTALIYGWDRPGEHKLQTSVYHEENLYENVILYSYFDPNDFDSHFAKHRPDLIITIGGDRRDYPSLMKHIGEMYVTTKWCHYFSIPTDQELANDVVVYATQWACNSLDHVFNNSETPYFSVFTGAYKTGDRLYRTYEGIKNQTYLNWEWVVVDDSPEDHTETWNILQELARKDYRVRPFKITPISGGNIGEVKNRACSMANGNWFVELDHDDFFLPTLMEDAVKAMKKFPDAGFIYTDVCEPYEDGQMRQYTKTIGKKEDWYANPNNTFVWAYGGHEWVQWDGKDWLCHRYPAINPKTIRFNIGMPNHARMWHKDVYHKVSKHNRFISVADDYELIVRTFLETKFIHIPKMLYLQWNNRNSTVDWNAKDINRKARIIRDFYNQRIHNRIEELGQVDWDWNEEKQTSSIFQNDRSNLKYFEHESKLNYTYDEKTS